MTTTDPTPLDKPVKPTGTIPNIGDWRFNRYLTVDVHSPTLTENLSQNRINYHFPKTAANTAPSTPVPPPLANARSPATAFLRHAESAA